MHLRRASTCASLLLLGVIADRIFTPIPLTETETPPFAREVAPALAVAGLEPAAIAAQAGPPAQKTESKPAVPPVARASTPEARVDVEGSDVRKTEPDGAASLTPEQPSKTDEFALPSDTQPSSPKTAAAVAQPLEAQKPLPKATAATGPQLLLTAEIAQKVGQKVWFNESAGRRDAITSWNASENFASLGIGHFIWFPAGKNAPFEESFPALIEFLRKDKAHLPAWLNKTPVPPCPWINRADFKKQLNSPQMTQLRQFLLDTMAEQAQFLVARAQGAMDKILEKTPDSAEREHIVVQFSRVAQASSDRYPLIDYINFKGEGSNPAETTVDTRSGDRQGWGLKQVLLTMNGTTSDPKAVLAEFADAAQFVLQRRVRNNPASRIWEAGWLHRVDTYRRPIPDLQSGPIQVRYERPRASRPRADQLGTMNSAR
jgi:hypothetical protein